MVSFSLTHVTIEIKLEQKG